MNKALIIIPTYNEIENSKKLIPQLLEMYPFINILVVDDNSPDGTADFVKQLSEKDDRVHLLKRERKMGLGTAYVAGFRYMLENNYDLAFEMDADFSHDPKEIKNFLKAAEENDLVIGSRYINGVNVMPICDSTGGFKCFRRAVLKSIDLKEVRSYGYAFQIELNFKAWKKGFRLKEIPIIFVDRVQGTSKMSKKIVHEAIFMVWKLRIRSMLGILR